VPGTTRLGPRDARMQQVLATGGLAVDVVGEFSDLTISALHSRLKRHHLPEAEKAEASADAG